MRVSRTARREGIPGEVSTSLPFDDIKRRDLLKIPSRPKPVRFQPKAVQEQTKKAQEEAPEYSTLFKRAPIKITKRKTQQVPVHVIEPIAIKRRPLVDINRGPLVDWDKTTESPTVPEFYGFIPYAGPSSAEGPPHISKTPSGHDIYIGLYTDLKRRFLYDQRLFVSTCPTLPPVYLYDQRLFVATCPTLPPVYLYDQRLFVATCPTLPPVYLYDQRLFVATCPTLPPVYLYDQRLFVVTCPVSRMCSGSGRYFTVTSKEAKG
uniref:Uncharacterized protein n=1 Tax=Timema shepardi TaxID=629360 RepID=A0A7R9B8U6_TIMSH|nr:unnamed protein product [Timema shepardi]